MSRADDAVNTFRSGFNCSQAVLSAFSADYGLDTVMAYRVGPAKGACKVAGLPKPTGCV